jgi:hypothetical protein
MPVKTHGGVIRLAVGQPFYRPMEVGSQFSYSPQGDFASAPDLELVLGFDRPTEAEIKGFGDGLFEAVLAELEGTPFVCARFSIMETQDKTMAQHFPVGWQECPVHPVMANGYVPPAPDEPCRWLLAMFLVDTSTQRVAAMRAATLGNAFCQAFSEAMRAHRGGHASAQDYLAKLISLYRRYPVGTVVDNSRLLAHTLGGD